MDLPVYDKQYLRGYAAMLSVLIAGAISTVIGVSLLFLGLSSSRSSFALVQSNKAKALANACIESALQEIRNNTSFTATDTNLPIGCFYTIVNTGGENRTATASATVGTIVRKVKVTITAINPQITISSWQEVADFN